MLCGFLGVTVAGKQWRETRVLAQAGLSRPSGPISPRRDLQKQARFTLELSFERGISLRREGLA